MKGLSFCLTIFTLLTAASYAVAGEVREKLSGYQKIEVAPFRNSVGQSVDDKLLAHLHQMVVNRINESKLFTASFNQQLRIPKKDPQNSTKLAFEGTSNAEDAKTLVLFGDIVLFNKGSRAKRYVGGTGEGRSELVANCFLVDKKSGTQLYSFESFGETNYGLMGGGFDKTLKGFANRIVGFLKGQ